MSAFGTKKKGADFAQQLTFPTVFSEVVAEAGANPYGYMPQSMRPATPLPVGDDLQDKYHQQKMMDAHRRVMNAVADNRASTARFLKSHQNYILPKPVLSQRIYANPSNGNQADIYSHRPIQWEVNWDNMVGGVLFTQQAQKWGRQKLKDRVAQLDAIQQAKQEFLTGTPMVDATAGIPSGVEEFPAGSKVELVALLQTIQSAVEGGKVNALTVAETIKFLRLLFRWATTASLDDLTDVFNYIEGEPDGIITGLEALEDEFAEGVAEGAKDIQAYTGQTLELIRKVAQYLKIMIGGADKSPAERKRLSENAIKTLGFTKLSQTFTREQQLLPERLRQSQRQYEREARKPRYRDGDDDYDIEDIWADEPQSEFSEEPREELARRSGIYSDDFSGVWSPSDRSSSSSGSDMSRPSFSSSSSSSDSSGRSIPSSYESSYAPSSVSQRSIPSSVSSANSFRSLKSAEMPLQEARQVAPLFVDEEKQPARKKTPSVKRPVVARPSASAQASSSSASAEGWSPEWLTRQLVNEGTEAQLRQYVMRLNQEGAKQFGSAYKPYHPQAKSDRKSIKRYLIDRFKPSR